MPPFKKILVIRLSSLGDIILSFPLLKKLKEKFPDSEIHYLTMKRYQEAVLLNPDIDNVMLYEESLSLVRKNISLNNFDLIIDIHKNLKSIYLSFANAKNIIRYKKDNFRKYLLVNFKVNLFRDIFPVWKKYILAAKDYFDSDEYEFSVSDLRFDKTKTIDGKYIVISPVSRHFTKTYPADKFIKTINEFAVSNALGIILVGDNTNNEMNICNYIESKCPGVKNLCGKLNLTQLAGIIYNSEYVICNDSAILHLAEALGKKVVAIFGSTVQEFGFFPQLNDSRVLEIKSLECRPCTHIGRENCPRGHFKCMNEVQLIINNI